MTILSCGQPSALASKGRISDLPLIAGMDLEDAVLLEGERVDRLESGNGARWRSCRSARAWTSRRAKAASTPSSSTTKHAAVRVGDQLRGVVVQILLRRPCAASPVVQSTLTRSAARMAAG